jgi:RNA polymerase sigma factor (sigma-70 family)
MDRGLDTTRKIYRYEDIDNLVRKYKKGDEEAIAELLKAFEGFIIKYANFLFYGRFDRQDWDIQGLIKMLQPKGMSDGSKDRLPLIRSALQSYEYDDIVGELNAMFMESALIFKKRRDGPTFAGFLYSYFKFMVKRWIDKRMKDALNVSNLMPLPEREDNMQMLENTQEFEMKFSKAKPVLDSVTRWILHLYFIKNYTDPQIAKIVGVTSKWICIQRRRAMKRMRELGVDGLQEMAGYHVYKTKKPLAY